MRTCCASILAALLTSACALGTAPVAPALFDLGPAVTQAPLPGPALQLTSLSAPSWLDTPGIAYRLDHVDAFRREVYRDSRWVAAPTALLGERLRQRFAAASQVAAKPLALRLELEEFSQVFSSPTQSQVRLRARAWLGEASGVPRVFEIILPVPTADAAGAVQGLSRASDALAGQLLAWAAQP